MNFKFGILLLAVLIGLNGCSSDVDTPADKKRSSYLGQTLQAASGQQVSCGDKSVALPASTAGETLETYLLQIHSANMGGDLSTMSIHDLQVIYRSCLRPLILNRFDTN